MQAANFGSISDVVAVGVAAWALWATFRSNRVATHVAALEWSRDLRSWASEAIDVLACASYATADTDKKRIDRSSELVHCRHRMSALIDRGRFFFPNQQDDQVGGDKPTAYRGWRHRALDPLVAAEVILSGRVGSGKFESRSEALIAMRREFVSSIQRVLAPEIANAEIARLVRDAHVARTYDASLGGLIPQETAAPSGADRLLYSPQKSV